MLRLIICEFTKLKRKKFVLLVILSAFIFPVPITVMMTTPQMAKRFSSDVEVFNACFQFIMGYGVELLLRQLHAAVWYPRSTGSFINCLWQWKWGFLSLPGHCH